MESIENIGREKEGRDYPQKATDAILGRVAGSREPIRKMSETIGAFTKRVQEVTDNFFGVEIEQEKGRDERPNIPATEPNSFVEKIDFELRAHDDDVAELVAAIERLGYQLERLGRL